MKIQKHADRKQASAAVADEIATLIRERQADCRNCVLGLATGSTPLGVYSELARLHREDGLSFANVVTFNLDEYFPMHPDAPQSYVRFMNANLFDHVDIRSENIHIPDGTLDIESVDGYCRNYETQITEAGGIDIQLLGIGRTGHVGFNEPGSDQHSLTRLVTLNAITRTDAAKDFLGIENVPKQAITMGVHTILNARRIRLLAFGDHKADIVKRAVDGVISKDVPATHLQTHDDVEFLLDANAAALLTDVRLHEESSK